MFKMILNQIEVNMFIGICDFERENRQKVVVNLKAYGNPTFNAQHIDDCLDYSKLAEFITNWYDRPHVDLIETLMHDVIDFCFKDNRIDALDVEILKPEVISNAKSAGVGAYITRSDYMNKTYGEVNK
jgi:dihydroneopterin aldolase